MTNGERALQFWSVLALAVSQQKVVSYNMLFQFTGMAKVGVGKPLGHIAAYCERKGLPLLNLLAISEDGGKPEAEFLQGVELLSQQSRVFVHDWRSVGAPKVEELESAFAAAVKSGRFQKIATVSET